jgi:GTPase SAR1 family protein
MGGCLSGGDDDKSQDRRYNDQLSMDRESERHVKKLLLLGPGNSGKSTFIKQLLQIHGSGFTEKHIIDATRNIYDSILIQMKNIIANTEELGYELREDSKQSASYLLSLPRDIEINEQIGNAIKILWNDPAIKLGFENRKNEGIVDSCKHFFNDIDRISKVDYRPNEQDILLVRTASTGVSESKFEMNKHKFRIFDVGGQRSERNKWIHCFDAVTAVIFVASLSCYDLSLYEDANTNAMHEAINLFDDVCNSRWFKQTPMILFLNKSDIFELKILKRPLSICFPDYSGENLPQPALDYIKLKFSERNYNNRQRQIYTHVTCATDRDQVERVFNDIQHIVVQASLARGGLL